MRGRKAAGICLTQRQRWVLEDVVRRPTSSQRDAQRAAIILAAATGASNQEIARQLHRDRDTVACWRNRWHDAAAAWQALEENPKVELHEFRDLASQILGDAPRPGAPLKFSAEQVCEIIAVACEQPEEESERPVSHWSRRELADEVKKRGIVAEISPRSVGRFLNQAELQPHRSEYWLHASPQDPEQFAREVQQVCEVYVQATALETQGVHAVSSDEKTAIQAIERRITPARPQEPSQAGVPGRRGQPEHREHTYRRHGTLTLIVSFLVALGKVRLATAGPTRGERDFQQHVEQVVATDPQGGWIFIVDRLNTHDSESLVRYVAAALGDPCDLGKKGRRGILKSAASRRLYLSDPEHRIRFVYLPKHSSWLNQVECWFGILVRRLLKRGSFRSVEELKARILAFVEYFNQTMAKPMRWTYTGRPLA